MQPSARIAKSIVSVLKLYNWNRVVVLAGKQSNKFIYIKDAFEVMRISYVHQSCDLYINTFL